MTDNDIIKALDWCEQFENNLVFKGDGSEKYALALQMMVVIKHALKNYNRQKAEIERLETENRLLIDRNCELAEKGEKAIVYFKNSKASARTEAIKEFAERLKDRTIKVYAEWDWRPAVTTEVIDNLVKEMVGERE